MAQAGDRAGKTQCKQMGENELEWVSVTSSSMNVRILRFFILWLVEAKAQADFGLELVVSLSKPCTSISCAQLILLLLAAC